MSCEELYKYDSSFPSGLYSIAVSTSSGEVGEASLYCKNAGSSAASYIPLPEGRDVNYAHWFWFKSSVGSSCENSSVWQDSGETIYSKIQLDVAVGIYLVNITSKMLCS